MVDFPSSSMVESASFDEARGVLYVTFRGGARYAYPATADHLADMQAAPSAGQYVHDVLKALGGRRV